MSTPASSTIRAWLAQRIRETRGTGLFEADQSTLASRCSIRWSWRCIRPRARLRADPMSDGAGASDPAPEVPASAQCSFEREVRFAVVLYGGVSLAVYINGIVQELLHLVRATAPAVPTSDPTAEVAALVATPVSTEAVYRRLGQFLTLDGCDETASLNSNHAGAIRTRFVVDILSGSSAGGINGIVLGKALATGADDINDIRQLWLHEADLANLVNDKASTRGIPGLRLQDPPQSLLSNARMAFRLLEALDAMEPGQGADRTTGGSCYVDELDCWATATDLAGLVLPIRLDDEVVQEARYKSVFRFLYRSPHASGEDDLWSDFGWKDNPFLTFAARATASFPFAFEPMTLDDMDSTMSMAHFHGRYSAASPIGDHFQHFYRDYATSPGVSFTTRAFGDGGILDNRPFTWATATLTRRRADVPVDRHLIYLEPAPDADAAPGSGTPDAITVVGKAISLPRKDSIRDDLARLRERNQALEWMEQGLEVLDLVRPEGLPLPGGDVDWVDLPIATLADTRGLQWVAYHKLHLADVLADLSDLVARLCDIDSSPDARAAVRVLVDTWFRDTYEQPPAATGMSSGPSSAPTQARFLLEFDLGFRLRRVAFLDDRIDHLLTADSTAFAELLGSLAPALDGDESTVWREAFRRELRALKPKLNQVLVDLRRAGRGLQRGRGAASAPAIESAVMEVRNAIGMSSATALVTAIFGGSRSPERASAKAHTLLAQSGASAAVSAFARAVAAALRTPLMAASTDLGDALQQHTEGNGAAAATDLLKSYSRAYEAYDMVILPFVHSGIGEAGRVGITRISPASAKMLVDEQSRGPKLAGTQFAHFGGFFSKDWRCNDMMWGRLDAAERLICGLVPLTAPDRDAVVLNAVKEAQISVLEDEGAAARLGVPDLPGDALWEMIHNKWSVDLTLDERATRREATRALGVTQRLFAGIASAHADASESSGMKRFGARVAALVPLAISASIGWWGPLVVSWSAVVLGAVAIWRSLWWLMLPASLMMLTAGAMAWGRAKFSRALKPSPVSPPVVPAHEATNLTGSGAPTAAEP